MIKISTFKSFEDEDEETTEFEDALEDNLGET